MQAINEAVHQTITQPTCPYTEHKHRTSIIIRPLVVYFQIA